METYVKNVKIKVQKLWLLLDFSKPEFILSQSSTRNLTDTVKESRRNAQILRGLAIDGLLHGGNEGESFVTLKMEELAVYKYGVSPLLNSDSRQAIYSSYV